MLLVEDFRIKFQHSLYNLQSFDHGDGICSIPWCGNSHLENLKFVPQDLLLQVLLSVLVWKGFLEQMGNDLETDTRDGGILITKRGED